MFSSDLITHSPQASGIRQLDTEQVQKLRAFIKRRVMNPDDVEDILQGTFLEALRNEHKFRFDSRPQTWLCGIALNLIRNHFRRQYKQPLHERWEDREEMELSDGVDIGAQIDGHRQLTRVVRAIATLPLTMRQVIQVSLEMDGNYQDTAQSLGVPIGTVRSRLSRAREQLKRSVPGVF
ncbi:RNA polymerase subunit sigma [Pseudomonas agarici]|uniref:RNA polymerase sigma factor n=1 Tax=Pseudomonas agarici TaxID=46677 RepID=A0A0X1T617_PSEAA|nr:sigma-70 family RNA polymerase sigma factor [Pseudomonas agarici]AMB87239.1 RNA polymerase subunit sigma [Pseudomonas agarici]NWB92682.1 sigma-70 family RNA polymerase sigma factor [Pseudomonas agarici]NWC10642.1 sigma-70 family RNA polymerase sigma factor [Pseudomonas agarici]SEL11916.1 RNA polymerase sigma factor, sigma-70 family [Pseudomonas agarici]